MNDRIVYCLNVIVMCSCYSDEKHVLAKSLVLLRGKLNALQENATDLCRHIDQRVTALNT